MGHDSANTAGGRSGKPGYFEAAANRSETCYIDREGVCWSLAEVARELGVTEQMARIVLSPVLRRQAAGEGSLPTPAEAYAAIPEEVRAQVPFKEVADALGAADHAGNCIVFCAIPGEGPVVALAIELSDLPPLRAVFIAPDPGEGAGEEAKRIAQAALLRDLPGSKAAQGAREGKPVEWEVFRHETLLEALEASEAVFANDIWWRRSAEEAFGAVVAAQLAQENRDMPSFFDAAPQAARFRRDNWTGWLADKALNPWHAAGPDYYEAEREVSRIARKCEESSALLPVRSYTCAVSKDNGEPEARVPLPDDVMPFLGAGACIRAPRSRARQVAKGALQITGLWVAVSGAGWDAGILSAGAIGLAFEEAGRPAPKLAPEEAREAPREESPLQQQRRMRATLRRLAKNAPAEKPKNKKIGSH